MQWHSYIFFSDIFSLFHIQKLIYIFLSKIEDTALLFFPLSSIIKIYNTSVIPVYFFLNTFHTIFIFLLSFVNNLSFHEDIFQLLRTFFIHTILLINSQLLILMTSFCLFLLSCFFCFSFSFLFHFSVFILSSFYSFFLCYLFLPHLFLFLISLSVLFLFSCIFLSFISYYFCFVHFFAFLFFIFLFGFSLFTSFSLSLS